MPGLLHCPDCEWAEPDDRESAFEEPLLCTIPLERITLETARSQWTREVGENCGCGYGARKEGPEGAGR